jgi:N-methylhydantoinase A
MLSALGLLVSDLRKEFVRSFLMEVNPTTIDQLADIAKAVTAEASSWCDEQGESGRWVANIEAELRYQGQEHSLRIGLPDLPWDAQTVEVVRDNFDELHEQLNGYRVTRETIELVSLRVTCAINVGGAGLQLRYANGSGVDLASSDTPVWWTREAAVSTPVFSAPDLRHERWIDGPAILVQEDSTCAVSPGYRFCTLSETGGVAIQRIP